MSRFHKILIANRGEIACRIIRTARAMGYPTVALFSEADRDAPHVALADEAVCIGAAPASESYLSVAKILAAAEQTGADAIHPGYGFLAENAEFAEAVTAKGLVFIGPPAEAIRLMGSKRLAKERMIAADVPCVPGYSGATQDEARLVEEAQRVGYPLMIKASAGGGGRGLRRVDDESGLREQLALARSEAESAFGDGELILERAIINPRHVEIQVFADSMGGALHLGERDCSVQRRHQKVVEEAPSPAVDAALRARMGAAAVAAAKAIGYVGAGTCEFLVDDSGDFYFMEMNTRLQVEHPVTELVTGLDLVAWQLDVAAGAPLPVTQDDVAMNGHAIEVRLYAEDPEQQYLPQVGALHSVVFPEDAGVRIDAGVVSGQAVTPHYDAMIAKLMAHGRDREEARRRLCQALRRTRLFGVVTNRDFLLDVLEHPVFVEGRATTAFLDTHGFGTKKEATVPDQAWMIAALLWADASTVAPGPGWSSAGARRFSIAARCGDEERRVAGSTVDGNWSLSLGDAPVAVQFSRTADRVSLELGGHLQRADYFLAADELYLNFGGRTYQFERQSGLVGPGSGAAANSVVAPMAGRVIRVDATPGATVQKGQVLLVLEAMKMQMEVPAPRDGTVEAVSAAPDQQVNARQVLVTLREEG